MAKNKLLEVKDLKIDFPIFRGTVKALKGINFDVFEGETLGVVGESGCGKSITARSIMQLIPSPGKVKSGDIKFYRNKNGNRETIDILQLDPDGKKIRNLRGSSISMIFQEPMVSLCPVYTIGNQLIETIMLHQDVNKKTGRAKAVEMLDQVGIPDPDERLDSYSFELSGGMRQRAMIAIALSCEPSLLIADEPTTALDVTVQAQILELLKSLQQKYDMATMLITHNLGVIASLSQRVVVMYLGKIVEEGTVKQIFDSPKHPYTQGLLKSVPDVGVKSNKKLWAIKGSVPDPLTEIKGCQFHPRCPEAEIGLCDKNIPDIVEIENGQKAKCFLYSNKKLMEGGDVING